MQMPRPVLVLLARLAWVVQRISPALVLLLVVMGGPAGAQTGTPLVLAPETPRINAWDAIRIRPDPTLVLSATDMLERLDEFEPPAQRGGSLGVHKAAMWLHVPLVAHRPLGTPWMVDVGYFSLNAEIYLARDGRILRQMAATPARTSLASRTPALDFEIEPGQPYDLLIRVQATGPLILPITIGEMPLQMHHALRDQMLQGLLNGLALCLLAYSLIQWITQRERLFAFYALVVGGSAVFSMQFFGIGAQYLWPGSLWMSRYGGVAAGLTALVGSFLFLGHVLADPRLAGWYPRTMRAGAAITAAVLAGLVAGWVSVPLAIAFMSLVGPVPSMLSLPAALGRIRARDPIGLTLLLAWTAYGVAAAVMVCLVQGWVPANFWTMHSFQFGATIDMLLFLRVMGLRANAIRIEAQEARREGEMMRRLAHSDPLTGLSNRRGLQVALHDALGRCAPDRLVAVYLLDLDGFKPINDRYGHDVGDDLLVAVGHRLQANVRQHLDVVARLGGDEFIIMAHGLQNPQQAHDIGQALLEAFDSAFALETLQIRVGLTIGYALAPLDALDAQHLIRQADAAMYAGKQEGKNTLRRAMAHQDQPHQKNAA